jgi:hypothetical protein
MLGLIGGFAARAVVSGSSAGGSTANATAVAPASQTDDASSDDPTSGAFAPAVPATQQGFSNPVTTTHSS